MIQTEDVSSLMVTPPRGHDHLADYIR